MVKQSSKDQANPNGKDMYIVNITDLFPDTNTISEAFDSTEGIWENLYSRMDSKEILWVIAPNQYRDSQMWPVAMAAADYIRSESKFILKNTVTVHQISDQNSDMRSSYIEILLLVKNKREYQFHKDEIRVSHVYEGNEWGGKREKGNSAYHDTEVRRYNPDGKDPGNVWLKEDRSLSENQEIDATAPLPWKEAIRRCVLIGSEEGETVHALWTTSIEDTVIDANRDLNKLNAQKLREQGQ